MTDPKLVGKLLDLADYFEPNDLSAALIIREAAAELKRLVEKRRMING